MQIRLEPRHHDETGTTATRNAPGRQGAQESPSATPASVQGGPAPDRTPHLPGRLKRSGPVRTFPRASPPQHGSDQPAPHPRGQSARNPAGRHSSRARRAPARYPALSFGASQAPRSPRHAALPFASRRADLHTGKAAVPAAGRPRGAPPCRARSVSRPAAVR